MEKPHHRSCRNNGASGNPCAKQSRRSKRHPHSLWFFLVIGSLAPALMSGQHVQASRRGPRGSSAAVSGRLSEQAGTARNGQYLKRRPSSYYLPEGIESQVESLVHDQSIEGSEEQAPPGTGTHATKHFQTLQCNIDKNLPSQSCSETWSSLFGAATSHTTEIVIPCGQCITMDHAASTLSLAGGLDIQGKLVFPDGYQLILDAPYVRVQGELHMYSTKIPDGKEDVKIVLTGTDENLTAFRPADSNADLCDGQECPVGKKPIAVAGGKVVIEGLSSGTPTWVNLYDVVGDKVIVVSDSVQNKWGPGSEVLITSHTYEYDAQQVLRITNIRGHSEAGYVVLELNSTLTRPTTVKENPNFAVEVALLSRNIVFEGAQDDPEFRHGAHFIVIHTPSVAQKLQGVEFRNFGQQGLLGRYPIHFHVCGDVTGSIVSKNLIRLSNQRCIVIHRTNNVAVDANVAYDTSGHCFMTEDGNEVGNVFSRNLGALTRSIIDLIPDDGTNGRESDDNAATYWMSNPSNSWVGNVAAGSQVNGFWLELKEQVRGHNPEEFEGLNPRWEALTLFTNNVAHSNGDTGFRTYPSGYLPKERAVFLDSRFYRNKRDGAFIHKSRNITLSGGVYGENIRQIDIDRSDEIIVRDATIVGVSDPAAPSACDYYKWIVGIQLHTFANYLDGNGTMIENVSFSGFVGTKCDKAVAIMFDPQSFEGRFNLFSTLSRIQMEEGTQMIDMCDADDTVVSDMYITDIDSSLSSSSTSGTSTVISNGTQVATFIPAGKCTASPDHCYTYCEDTCLRTVMYAVDPANTDSYKLKVCQTSDSDACVEITGAHWLEDNSTDIEAIMTKTQAERLRHFEATLPKGSYTATFIDSNGNEAWPTFADATFGDAICSDILLEGTVRLVVPSLQPGECNNLIRNGDGQASSTDPTYWLHRRGGVMLAPGQGRDGSNALGDLTQESDYFDAIAQYLDTRCMQEMKGALYEIKAWVKLLDTAGSVYTCDRATEACPVVGIVASSPTWSWGREPAASAVVSHVVGDYQLLHGVMEIHDEMVSASNVLFYVKRRKKDLAMFLDDVSMEPMPQSADDWCNNLLYNGDMADGDTRFWDLPDGIRFEVVSPGVDGAADYALKMLGGSAQQYTKSGCLQLDERYVASAKFKLLDSEESVACDNSVPGSGTKCPTLKLVIHNGSLSIRTVAYTMGQPTGDGWNTLYGMFTADDLYVSAESIRLTFDEIADGMDLIVDDVSVQMRPMDCSELILNGDMEQGCALFWEKDKGGVVSNIEGHNSPNALRYSDRPLSTSGPVYASSDFLDYRCLTPQSTWEISAQLKLFETGTDTGASCQLINATSYLTACPSVRVIITDSGDRLLDAQVNTYDVSVWEPNDFNAFRGTFTVPDSITENAQASIVVRDFNTELDVVVDDFSIRPA